MKYPDKFTALVASDGDAGFSAELKDVSINELPDNDVLVKIDYSTLNYKDALAVSGRGKICRNLPMVCGIDFAGTVVESKTSAWSAGDQVLVNGFGMSEIHWGGYSQYQRVRSEWLIRTPPNFDSKAAMAIGTAGYTAMLCINAIKDHGVTPEDGPVVVTGASGGVGSVAISLLSQLGYEAVAVSGRESMHDYLMRLGASSVLSRDEFSRKSRPLEKERWSASIDSVGSSTLATLLAQTKYNGIVTACGLAGGLDLSCTVMPFILRGVTLKGVDSVMAPMADRERAWASLSQLLTTTDLNSLCTVKGMSEFPSLADQLLDGKLNGRVVIDVNA
ncbi:MDR family oxidoreductase [Arenicella sp. 4NH20-0111]|uniref:acrylyl-CoA reductase (NADPH) n=1 Tax=Arenicella sp. 4NH20-0111 TaxID=3127648 RepID=UPI00310455C6